MQEVYEIVERYITIRTKCMLLNDDLKDLNKRKDIKKIEPIRDGAVELCNSLFEKLNLQISKLPLYDLNELIYALRIESQNFNSVNFDFNNSNRYRSKACNELINYLRDFEKQPIK